ncbi:MAG: DUF1624 domain-containing protein [Alphaproteobacteria bacterium]|jgi:uncharacterized membrane protein|nr:DUF1624 domain-containing protein [Alphaproteobacteria bacterium]MBT4018342.1 DUF1624 domain-containing protein [Alphaproteobacteria bacterium]MBT4966844.1 DUF1624 domain-containing protein [Alphaproteobacteria bacterium]MBT5160716.1 DUF1624 domain-containing protein [Alphaproteobacteria bacterium]
MPDASARQSRYAIFDVIRGTAILLMIVYHFSWDLTFFGLADFRIFTDPWWIWFANIIVIMILGVMGVSQVMARQRAFKVAVFARRLALIAGAAGAVSLATWFMDPGTYVFFGILHHIAVASVLIAGAILLPSAVLIVLAALLLAAPFYFAHDIFAFDWMLWLGLSPIPPAAVDYVPLAPWFAVPLFGIVMGRWFFQTGFSAALLAWNPQSHLARIVRYAGRHSLAVYLIHQPVLYGGLYLVMVMMGRITI